MHLLTATGITAQHFIQAFSWMLLHSLWQGLLLAVITGLILTFARRLAASVRYNLVLVQFILFISGCLLTFIWEWARYPRQSIAHPLAGAVAATSLPFNLNADGIRAFARVCITYFSANAPMVVLLWFILFVFRSMRMMGSLVYIHRARHRYVYQPSAEWKEKVDALCQKLQLKRAVQLLESGYVKMPIVIGHLKPVILIPVGLLAGLPAGQVEAILLHELAHIRRHDYVVNFMQTIAETVFFFNPGLLWISSLLRDERENCCDDIALTQTKNKKEFVQALISFKEHALYGTKYEVAFPGKKNHLLNRVSRILNNKNKALAPAEKAFFMAGVLILSAIVATAAIAQAHSMVHVRAKTSTTIVYTSKRITEPEKIAGHAKRARMIAIMQPQTSTSPPVLGVREPSAPPEVAVSADQTEQVMIQQSDRDRQQAAQDQQEANKEQEQAKRDQQQARLDQSQGQRDREQAQKDREQAKRDQAQARMGQEAALHEQGQANAQEQEQTTRNEAQAKLNKLQEQKNREQAERNKEQARLNEIQDQKNQEQARLNEVQAKKNEEQAKRNNKVSVQQ